MGENYCFLCKILSRIFSCFSRYLSRSDIAEYERHRGISLVLWNDPSFTQLKDTGRLTYHELLLAWRRSQRTRSRCSSRASRLPTSSSTSQSQSTKQTPNHTDDESFHFDYLPNQQNQSPPEQSRRNDFKNSKHSASKYSLPGVQQRPAYQDKDSETVDDDDFAFPPPPEKDEPVYIRPSFPEKRNSRTRRARRDKYPSSAGAKNNASVRIQEENQTPLSAKRTYNQSAYG